MEALSDISKNQIARFSAHFKDKCDRVIATRNAEMEDFCQDNLADDSAIFNVEGVKQLIEVYHQQVISRLRDDMNSNTAASAVYMSQLMAQAELTGFALQVEDISSLEDPARAAQLSSAFAAVQAAPSSLTRNNTLTPMDGGSGDTVRLLQQLEDLKQENRELKDKNLKIETQMTGAARERAAVSTELEQVKANFKAHLAHQHEVGGAGLAEYQHALSEAQASLAATSAECDAVKRELSGRLGDSQQFRDLKLIVQRKTEEVKAMRNQLAAAGLALPDTGEGVELAADSD